ncbi:MAG: DUF3304 domain-containing protein [Burkholderiales bacterium]|nr:DUF3304 domain-containing protein [Burkholderiales bacterium]
MNRKIKQIRQFWLRSILLSLFVLTQLVACDEKTDVASEAPQKEVKLRMGTRVGLALNGYNYTNRYIDSFSVDGQGGGNLFVSGPTSGGGGGVCCVSYRIGASAWKTKIRWQTDACTYDEKIIQGERFYEIYSFFKEVEVQIDPKIPDHPHYFEVHFYPDGHVEAAITEEISLPRLVLSKDREDNSHYRKCPNGKKPQE